MKEIIGTVTAVFILIGCASGPLTTREKTAVGGAAIGAGTGAIIGAASGGKAGTGALIGGAIGAVGGALLGDQMQKGERERGASVPPPPPPVSGAPPPPGTAVASKSAGDPTKGELINATSWIVRVYVNADPNNVEATTPVVLNPNAVVPWGLDIGTYRIIARAHVRTQYGERLVGRFDKTIQIDPRRPGWFLKFHESDFR